MLKKSSAAKGKSKVAEEPAKKKKPVRSGLDLKAVRRAAAEIEEGGKYYTLKPGTHSIRFMQNPNDNSFFVTSQKVYIPEPTSGKGKDKDKPKKNAFVSPRSLGRDQFCPAQAAYEALVRSGTEVNKKLAKEIKPSHRFYSNAVVKDPKTNEWKVVQMEYPPKVFQQVSAHLFAACEDEENELEEGELLEEDIVSDPETGVIFKITREGTGQFDTEYSVSPTTKKLPLKQEWLDARVDLSKEAAPSDVDAISDAVCEYLGIDDLSEITGASAPDSADGEEDDVDDDDPPVKKGRKVVEDDEDDDEDEPAPRKKKSKVVEEDDDDDDEPAPVKKKKVVDDDDDDDDEEPAPRKKKVVDEDDDDDEEPAPRKKKVVEEDDDDEEEPAPRKKKVVEEDDDDDDDEPAPRRGEKRAPAAVSRHKKR